MSKTPRLSAALSAVRVLTFGLLYFLTISLMAVPEASADHAPIYYAESSNYRQDPTMRFPTVQAALDAGWYTTNFCYLPSSFYDVQVGPPKEESAPGYALGALWTPYSERRFCSDNSLATSANYNIDPLMEVWAACDNSHRDTRYPGVPCTDPLVNPGKSAGVPRCPRCKYGDPINAATGNVYYTRTEFRGSGPAPLEFTWTYNSVSSGLATLSNEMVLGGQTTLSYTRSVHVYTTPDNAITSAYVVRGDGKTFIADLINGNWVFDADVDGVLASQTDSAGQYTGFTYVNEEGEKEAFDGSGNLTSITSRDGFVTAVSHDTQNRISNVQDFLGRTMSFSYDTNNRISVVTLPDSTTLTIAYNGWNNIQSITYADGTSIQLNYSEAGYVPAGYEGFGQFSTLLTGVIDENGSRYSSNSYNSYLQGTVSTLAGGTNNYTVTYDCGGCAVHGTNATGPTGATFATSFEPHLGVNQPISKSTSCTGCTTLLESNTFGADGRWASHTDGNGVVTTYTYGSVGLISSKVEALGTPEQRTTDSTWNTSNRSPLSRTVKNASGTVVSSQAWVYNARGQVLASCEIDAAIAPGYVCASTGTPPAGVQRTTYTYCDSVSGTTCPALGLLLTVDGPRTDVNDVTTYTYYTASSANGCSTPGSACHQAGDLYTIQDALGHTTTYASYDGTGRVTRITDPNGINTDITYDPRGRVLTRTYGGATTTYGYDLVGNLTQVTDPDNVITRYTYDAAHRLTDVTDALGNHIHYTLDNAGNKTAETVYDAGNNVKRSIGRTFNSLGQLTALRDGLNNMVLNAGFTDSYDANGNLVHTADALGIQRQSSFDGLNRLITTLDNYNGTDPATQNTTTRYGYDAKDNLVQVTDPSNLVTTYTLDGLNNQTALASPDTGTATATFDAAGNQLTRTDARGIVATSAYDALDRIVSTTYADTSLNVVYHYDEVNSTTGCPSSQPLGRLTRVVEVAVTTTYCYDARGNVIRKKQTQGAVSDTTAMAYTSANRLQSLTYPSGAVVSYTRDANGQIAAATLTPAGGTAASAVSSVRYLPFGPVLSYTLGNGQAVTRTYDANYNFTDVVSPALAIHIARDTVGNIVALGNSPGANPATETYNYDPLYRLTGIVDGTSTVQAFTYNATGDRLSKTGTGLETGAYSYAPGTHRLNGIGNGARAFDANGNTTAVVSAGQTYGFGYNERNRMTVAQANGQTVGTYIQNEAGERIGKLSSIPAGPIERFAYLANSTLVGEYSASSREYVWADNLPIAILDAADVTTTISFIHADALNTPRAITTSDGSQVWQWLYSGNAFGERDPLGSYAFNLRFPGQYHDSETQLLYNVRRNFDASSGRYLQSDPRGLWAGITTYAYVTGSPLLYTDMLGLSFCRAALQTVGAVCGGLAGNLAGGLLGSTAGGLVCSPTGPEGAIVCGAGGGAAGATAGGVLGMAAGAEAGNSAANKLCSGEPDCTTATNWHLAAAGIEDAHQVKSEYGAKPNSRYDLCACNDGSIVIKAHGTCSTGPSWEVTHYRWK